jgi:hypothetical protein
MIAISGDRSSSGEAGDPFKGKYPAQHGLNQIYAQEELSELLVL